MDRSSTTPPEELLEAVQQFNAGDWFECHETLEELWVSARGDLRDFYQGLLQVAVALHHWREGNFKGAVLLLEKGPELLKRVPHVCQGIDVADVIESATAFLEVLNKLGPDRMDEMDPILVPTLRHKSSS